MACVRNDWDMQLSIYRKLLILIYFIPNFKFETFLYSWPIISYIVIPMFRPSFIILIHHVISMIYWPESGYKGPVKTLTTVGGSE